MQLLHEVAWEKILFEVPEDNGAASAILQGDDFFAEDTDGAKEITA